MELLEIFKQIPMPILLLAVVVLLVVTLVIGYQYLKQKGLEGIRNDVYQLIRVAEHKYNGSAEGKRKLKWVVSQARLLLPKWLQLILTETALEKIIDKWFKGVKDLLDDGKVNNSVRE
ncbi:MAG: hypothetical protein E7253_07865 [Lachnospiraceae bacterium]|nr:hypothetical protein [Lachnospiraceae bacterium]